VAILKGGVPIAESEEPERVLVFLRRSRWTIAIRKTKFVSAGSRYPEPEGSNAPRTADATTRNPWSKGSCRDRQSRLQFNQGDTSETKILVIVPKKLSNRIKPPARNWKGAAAILSGWLIALVSTL